MSQDYDSSKLLAACQFIDKLRTQFVAEWMGLMAYKKSRDRCRALQEQAKQAKDIGNQLFLLTTSKYT